MGQSQFLLGKVRVDGECNFFYSPSLLYGPWTASAADNRIGRFVSCVSCVSCVSAVPGLMSCSGDTVQQRDFCIRVFVCKVNAVRVMEVTAGE